MTTPGELATLMVERLMAAGQLSDPRWREAFEQVPRHVFVPGHSAEEAYREAIVTQTRHTGDGSGQAWPTSSLSAPAAVAVPLDRLDVHDGHRVLEIGTGTGYVAALLSHRLGASQVCSIDIDPDLVATAARTLHRLGCHPVLACGDGYVGLAEHGPYDRIVATCSITHVPPEWIRQLAPGGRIVAPLDGDITTPYLILDKTAPDEVTGRFDPEGGGFMPLRPTLHSPLGPGQTNEITSPGPRHYGTTSLDPRRIGDADPHLTLFCRLHLPGLHLPSATATPAPSLFVHCHDAYAEVDYTPRPDGRWRVVQHGIRRIWDTLETALALHEHLGAPGPERLGVSATDDPHNQYVWLDTPDSDHAWPLPPPDPAHWPISDSTPKPTAG